MATKSFQANLPEGLIENFEETTRNADLTADLALADALTTWIAREQSRDQMTRDALQAVDGGRPVSHATVKQ